MWGDEVFVSLQKSVVNHLPLIGVAIGILLGTVIVSVAARRLMTRLSKNIDTQANPYFYSLTYAGRLPAQGLIWLIGIGWILSLLGSVYNIVIIESIPIVQRLLVIVVLAWFFIGFISSSYQKIKSNSFKGSVFDANTAEIFYKISQLVVIVVFSLMFLQSAGISITGLLAFGGVGGLAVGLAAKDMLANLFGGLVLYLDRPFHVGEKIKIIGSDVEGWVEEIGWRKTRVRNYDRQPIYVPNALFGNSAVINPSRISNRRIRQLIGIRYQDLDKVKIITQLLTQYIKEHKEIDKGRPIEIRLVEYSASSIDIQIYCFVACTDYEDLLRVQEDILLKAGVIIREQGADIAFPTRTLDIQWPEK